MSHTELNKSLSTRRIILVSCLLAFVLLFLSLIFFRDAISGRTQGGAAAQAQDEQLKADTNTARQEGTPLVLSNSQSDKELRDRIDRVLASSGLDSARWGVFVMSLSDGRVLYARDAEQTFLPASNMKLYTTAVALDMLGAGYRWRTSVYAQAAPDVGGTINGDLTLYGRGAPDLVFQRAKGDQNKTSLGELADELYRRGVRRVRGNLIGDESYFRGEPLGNGWLWNDVQWYFGAEVSALSIGSNEIDLVISPAGGTDEAAAIKLEPETDYVHLINDTKTVERGQPATIGINRGLSDNLIRVWGDFPLRSRGFRARLSVHQPALWAAQLFREELRARGITVEGSVLTKDARGAERFEPQRAVELASLTSKPLGEIVHATNKESLNLEAELLLRSLGKERGATAPETDPRKMLTRGDDEAGLAVVRHWLEQQNIYTHSLALQDGSGLSRLDLVTPEATARLLAAMMKSPEANTFRDSLPVAGRDGTLNSRMRAASERITAKTGTLTYTNSLSGYVLTGKGELLAFSIFCNNESTPASSLPVIDSIALLLAGLH